MKIKIDERNQMPVHPKAKLTPERLFKKMSSTPNPNNMIIGFIKPKKEKKHGKKNKAFI